MKNLIKKACLSGLIVTGLALATSTMAATTATSVPTCNCNCKFAVVNVAEVVMNSSQVKILKIEKEQKLKELQTWLETARADVKKQQTPEGQEKLLKKYNDQFAKKQEALMKEYEKKLIEIDKTVSKAIDAEAKKQGYTMVFGKGIVLYGGEDITPAIIKAVK